MRSKAIRMSARSSADASAPPARSAAVPGRIHRHPSSRRTRGGVRQLSADRRRLHRLLSAVGAARSSAAESAPSRSLSRAVAIPAAGRGTRSHGPAPRAQSSMPRHRPRLSTGRSYSHLRSALTDSSAWISRERHAGASSRNCHTLITPSPQSRPARRRIESQPRGPLFALVRPQQPCSSCSCASARRTTPARSRFVAWKNDRSGLMIGYRAAP